MGSTPKQKREMQRGSSFPMSFFHTPSNSNSRSTLDSTPETQALTPSTPLSTSSQHLRDHSDEGYLGELEEYRIRTLFQDELHNQSNQSLPHRSSARRSRRQHAFHKTSYSFDTGESHLQGSVLRRSKPRSRSSSSSGSKYQDYDITPATSLEPTSSDSSPDRNKVARKKRPPSPGLLVSMEESHIRFKLSHQKALLILLIMVALCSFGIVCWSNHMHTVDDEVVLQAERAIRDRGGRHPGAVQSGLAGRLVRMAGVRYRPTDKDANHGKKRKGKGKNMRGKGKDVEEEEEARQLKFSPPPPLSVHGAEFEVQDKAMYKGKRSKKGPTRTVFLGLHSKSVTDRSVASYPADFTDNTQYYGVYDSDDEKLSHMEVRHPLETEECVPMQDWQRTYHPSCNAMHELAMEQMGDGSSDNDFSLFGVKGFWRNAWRVDTLGEEREPETVVLKTLKFQHNFEDAHFEHDRVDAVAMERLTSSPHVINVFGFCGHSVMTEYADGSRLGELADKSKKKPLARLKIARDIAMGLADVHGIDGDGNATFVHLDINPANVVSIGGTLKLNDFNIGILLRWNTTSNTQCGFPAQYPNPQWRSPEEARSEQHLTEKVDIFSLGHIFFRLICGHEPWNKLEPGGKPTKEEINVKVQKGILPRIPLDIETSTDLEVTAIRDSMLACYRADPKQRPTARTIASELQSVLETLERENGVSSE